MRYLFSVMSWNTWQYPHRREKYGDNGNMVLLKDAEYLKDGTPKQQGSLSWQYITRDRRYTKKLITTS